MPELINTRDDKGALSSTPKPLASWYAQGLSDGLGDRLLMFDNSDAPSLELLRFRPDFALVPGFEAALRERVRRLAQFRHPVFARVRSVQRLEPDHDLALISNCTPGKRLSEVLHHRRGPAVAAALIQQLGPALALLQQYDNGIGHGVLSPARIVVSPDGRLTIVEHVIGPAIDALDLRTEQLAALGIALPPALDGAPAPIDIASDWYQLGLVAVSVLLGRPLTAGELPDVETLIDRAAGPTGRDDTTVLSPFMREWLARALQISGSRIESGAEGSEALDELLRKEQPRDIRRIESSRPATLDDTSPQLEAVPVQETAAPPQAVADPEPVPTRPELVQPPAELVARAELLPLEPFPTERDTTERIAADSWTASRPRPEPPPARVERPRPVAVQNPRDQERLVARKHVETITPRPAIVRESSSAPNPPPPVATRRPVSSVALAALALIAAVEAGIIGGLVRALWLTPSPALVVETRPSGQNVVVRSGSGDAPPMGITVAPDLRWVRVTTPAPAGVVGGKLTSVSTGTIAISSPIELKVMEGSRLLGSVPGAAFKLAVGRHDLELVNELLGYRLQQSVEVEGGQALSLHVAPPPGMVTIDASPWADVAIDGQPVGRTPLGPLPMMPGAHTIVFKHPAGGADNQRVIVKADARIRVVGKLGR